MGKGCVIEMLRPGPVALPVSVWMSYCSLYGEGLCNRNVTAWPCCSAGVSMDVILLIVWGRVV